MNTSCDDFIEPKKKIARKKKEPTITSSKPTKNQYLSQTCSADQIRRTRKCRKCGKFGKQVTAAEILNHQCDSSTQPTNKKQARDQVTSFSSLTSESAPDNLDNGSHSNLAAAFSGYKHGDESESVLQKECRSDETIARALQAVEGGGLGAFLLLQLDQSDKDKLSTKPARDLKPNLSGDTLLPNDNPADFLLPKDAASDVQTGFCHICKEDVRGMNSVLQQLHVNQCLTANYCHNNGLEVIEAKAQSVKVEVPVKKKRGRTKKEGVEKKPSKKSKKNVSFYLKSDDHCDVMTHAIDELKPDILSQSQGQNAEIISQSKTEKSIAVKIVQFPKAVISIDSDTKRYESLWMKSSVKLESSSEFYVDSLSVQNTVSSNSSDILETSGFFPENDHTTCEVCDSEKCTQQVGSDISKLLLPEFSHLQDAKIESQTGLVPVSSLVYKLRCEQPTMDLFQYSKTSVEVFVKFLYSARLDGALDSRTSDELKSISRLVQLPSLFTAVDHFVNPTIYKQEEVVSKHSSDELPVDSLFLSDEEHEDVLGLSQKDDDENNDLLEEENVLFEKLATQNPNKSLIDASFGLHSESEDSENEDCGNADSAETSITKSIERQSVLETVSSEASANTPSPVFDDHSPKNGLLLPESRYDNLLPANDSSKSESHAILSHHESSVSIHDIKMSPVVDKLNTISIKQESSRSLKREPLEVSLTDLRDISLDYEESLEVPTTNFHDSQKHDGLQSSTNCKDYLPSFLSESCTSDVKLSESDKNSQSLSAVSPADDMVSKSTHKIISSIDKCDFVSSNSIGTTEDVNMKNSTTKFVDTERSIFEDLINKSPLTEKVHESFSHSRVEKTGSFDKVSPESTKVSGCHANSFSSEDINRRMSSTSSFPRKTSSDELLLAEAKETATTELTRFAEKTATTELTRFAEEAATTELTRFAEEVATSKSTGIDEGTESTKSTGTAEEPILFEDSDSDIVDLPLAKRVKKFSFKSLKPKVRDEFETGSQFCTQSENAEFLLSQDGESESQKDNVFDQGSSQNYTDFDFSEPSKTSMEEKSPVFACSQYTLDKPSISGESLNEQFFTQPVKTVNKQKRPRKQPAQKAAIRPHKTTSHTDDNDKSSKESRLLPDKPSAKDAESKKLLSYKKLYDFIRSRPEIWANILQYKPLHILSFANEYEASGGQRHNEEFIRDFFGQYGIIGSEKTLSTV